MDTHIGKDPTAEQIDQASEILKLVSDPTRLKILWALLHGEHSVNGLADHVNAQPAAVSQHLAKLRIAGLVAVRRDGNKMFYKSDSRYIQNVIEQAILHTEKPKKGDHNG